ncbi:MAG: pyruvate dehydrogenase complex dihydrolipoamide acetyltransferase [Saprospiraceae bacterium]|nr:pyruvate dehydrogenase complex dihydrolipoamide acetyltransferase [Candidatus Opimibacter iunctus]
MAEIIRMPRLSDTMEEGNIVGWLKKVGDKVSPGDILAEVETDKATMELESFHEGYLLYVSVKEGPVPVNAVLAVIGGKDEDYKAALAGESKPAETPTPTPSSLKVDEKDDSPEKTVSNVIASAGQESRVKSSPLAKTIAAKSGIDLTAVTGTGDGGRIVKRDIENFVASHDTTSVKTNAPAASPQYGDVPLSQMRKTIARRLVESKFSAPHFYLTMKINMDKTAEARKLINEQPETRISFNDFVIKACAAALRHHPAVNSSWLGDKIRVNKDINIGVAVAVEEGLLVPVLFAADRMGLKEINAQVANLADKARSKKIQPQEMQGNTFTVSNLGMFGIDEFTGIINPPDAAILAVGAISEEIALVDGKVTAVKVMKVTLSCDHRVIDGATGAKFLQTLQQYLENPVSMLV